MIIIPISIFECKIQFTKYTLFIIHTINTMQIRRSALKSMFGNQYPKLFLSRQNLILPDIDKFINIARKEKKNSEEIKYMNDVLIETLANDYLVSLQNRLDKADYNYFIEHLQPVFFQENVHIIEKRKKNQFFYIIILGEVHILDQASQRQKTQTSETSQYKIIKEPKFEIINTLKRGQTFGQNSLLHHKQLPSVWVTTASQCFLLRASPQTYLKTVTLLEVAKQQQRLKYLIDHILFQDIHPNAIHQLLPEIRVEKYGLNDEVYRVGDNHDSLYLINNGQVEICREQGFRKSFGLVLLGKNQYFGIQDQKFEKQYRNETAISKSTDLEVFRIMFKRLFLLKGQYQTFVNNLQKHLNKKLNLHSSLYEKHEQLQCMSNMGFLREKPKKKSKRIRIKKLKPSLEWWGIAQDMNDTKNLTLLKYKCLKPQPKEEERGCIIFTESRLKQLVNLSKLHTEQVQQQQELSTIDNGWTLSFAPKKLKKNQQVDKALLIKNKILPKLHKKKLLSYAKSDNTFAEKLLLN